jgi:hypothetical protein
MMDRKCAELTAHADNAAYVNWLMPWYVAHLRCVRGYTWPQIADEVALFEFAKAVSVKSAQRLYAKACGEIQLELAKLIESEAQERPIDDAFEPET